MTKARSGPQTLPHAVTLPSSRFMAGWHVRDALGVSRQVLHLWRARYGFPAYHRDGGDYFTSTDALAEWLRGYGVRVSFVGLPMRTPSPLQAVQVPGFLPSIPPAIL